MKASLRLLLSGVIDYAGLFPPAGLPLDRAIGRYLQHLREPEAWMLGRFVIQAANLERLTPYAGADAIQPLPVAALGRGGDGAALLEAWAADHDAIARLGASPGPFVVEAVELRGPPDPQTASATAAAVAGEGLEAFYEVLLVGDWHGPLVGTAEALAAFNTRPRRRRAGLKLRCGGPEASAFPTVEHIAFAIRACRDAGVPMKFTAGLHHPLRRFDAGVQTHMHGFVNVFTAGVLAHARRLGEDDLRRVLADEDPAAFAFTDDGLRWREFSASTAEIAIARTDFVTSFGSCSFDEPRDDLRALGWM